MNRSEFEEWLWDWYWQIFFDNKEMGRFYRGGRWHEKGVSDDTH